MTPGRLRWLAPRRPLRDNPVLILLWIGLLVAALAAMLSLAARSSQLSLDFLSSVVLYAVSVADLTLMLALVFVLARNILKLVVERRRALPFARFRAKLVAALLGLTLIPAVLVLLVGSEIIRNAASRWFSPPIDTVISSAREIASDYYAERTARRHHARQRAGAGALDRRPGVERSHDHPQHPGHRARAAAVEPGRGVSRHRARDAAGRAPSCEAAAPSLPPGFAPAFVLALAHRVGRPELVARAPAVRRRAAARVGADPAVARRAADRRGHRQRLPDRRARPALRPHRRGLRGLHPAPRAAAADRGRLPVVLPRPDAADPDQRDVDGPVPGQADHAAGAAARRRRPRDRRRAPRPPHRAGHARRVRRARRGVQHDGERAGLEPAAARSLAPRSGAEEPRGRRAAALSRDHPRAHRHRRRLLRRAGPRQRRQPGGAAAARARRRRARRPGGDGVRPRRPASARRARQRAPRRPGGRAGLAGPGRRRTPATAGWRWPSRPTPPRSTR